MRRSSSKRSDLVANIKKLKAWFRERGYPEYMVNKKTKRVLETPSLDLFITSECNGGNGGTGIPLVVNYDPFIGKFFFSIPRRILYQLFTPSLFV